MSKRGREGQRGGGGGGGVEAPCHRAFGIFYVTAAAIAAARLLYRPPATAVSDDGLLQRPLPVTAADIAAARFL
jgi:hypothetical protein